MKFPKRGLYAVTCPDAKLSAIADAIAGGAVAIQYRDKLVPAAEKLHKACMLQDLCSQQKVPLIINDNPQLAAFVGADGVHLGKNDCPIADARQELGATAIIGVSCYNDIKAAISAQQQGADYVAFGRFFASNSKPAATTANIAILAEALAKITIPIVAIGGILPENGKQLLDAGAGLLAVIDGVFSGNAKQQAMDYQRLFQQTNPKSSAKTKCKLANASNRKKTPNKTP